MNHHGRTCGLSLSVDQSAAAGVTRVTQDPNYRTQIGGKSLPVGDTRNIEVAWAAEFGSAAESPVGRMAFACFT